MKLLRRILGRKDPATDTSRIPRPSIIERLDELLDHDRATLSQVLPLSERAFLYAEQLSQTSHTNVGNVLQTSPAETTDIPGRVPDSQATVSVNLATQEGIAQLQAAQQELEANLKGHRKRLVELSPVVKGWPGGPQGLQKDTAKEISNGLEKSAKNLLDPSDCQLWEQADATTAAGKDNGAPGEGFIDETKKQIASLTRAPLESLTKATMDEYRNQLTQLSQEQAQVVRQNADAVVNSINLASREAVTQLERVQQKIERSLEGRTEDYQKRLAELLSVIEQLQCKSDALQSQDNLRRIRQKEDADELERIAGEVLNRSAQQLQKHANTTLATLEEKLKGSRQEFVDETKKQLTGRTQGSLESLIKATTEQARSEFRKMLDEFLAKGLRELEAEQRELLRKQGDAIQKEIEDFFEARREEYRPEPNRVEPAPRHRAGGQRMGLKVGLGLVAMALILVGVYASAPPAIRLRAEPPAGFVDERRDWSAKRRAREEQLARAYWERAVEDLQAKYKFGANLPDEPPAEFRAEEKGLTGSSKVDPVARARYWEKVRQVWILPEAWDKSSGWSTDWIRSALQSAYSRAKGLVTGIVSSAVH